ncbi:DeoR/GlpR family DNA-binding transcription regulator [Cupriavidus metallidurans]|uniref:Transcriptional regulator, DeoR family n=1 Tax=Cupriavidus metallidurans (strain ATCC 43123 / DSM 2839 / NBRC 102507 / CH34) TaxID=266264 RepID=Q1LK58_CUPMC|nr:DeoR/GlpR family DNA-binding transcription regulator [Cupriavidus metallidurans]ABF09468.1 Transcriptional regulator, DeoR family [Cupriavidus metallidurans CH34]QGS29670.1 DeoR family transcriptional regulator [Cupriavidus metallidurans]UBM10161.1 DeoR/GlpR family DNA-binding transcription regulator [Cupriavidus metallidurans]
MKAADRRRAILELVLSGEDANVERLTSNLGVSEATVRRDLTALAREGRIVRTYGGAAPLMQIGGHEPEASLEERKALQRDQKESIARMAATFVDDGDAVLLDSGTTAAALARMLAARSDLHVYTTNLLVVTALVGLPEVRVTLIGGDVRPSSMGTFGPLAQLALSRISVDKAFLGADGVVAGVGLCEASAEQAYLKECIIRQAAEIFVLADSTKLGRARQQHWTPLERGWTLVTDGDATADQLEPFRALKQVRVAVAN